MRENYQIGPFRERKRLRSTAYDVFKRSNGRTNYSNEKGEKYAPSLMCCFVLSYVMTL